MYTLGSPNMTKMYTGNEVSIRKNLTLRFFSRDGPGYIAAVTSISTSFPSAE